VRWPACRMLVDHLPLPNSIWTSGWTLMTSYLSLALFLSYHEKCQHDGRLNFSGWLDNHIVETCEGSDIEQ
jgi:hypothetical protein